MNEMSDWSMEANVLLNEGILKINKGGREREIKSPLSVQINSELNHIKLFLGSNLCLQFLFQHLSGMNKCIFTKFYFSKIREPPGVRN
jgi:hypothetical protein